MISQSFLYNAIFFTYTLVLGKFYGVASASAPLYLIAFAVGNLAGPLTIGHFFDTIGRRKMIAGTYLLSGVLLAVSAVLFNAGVLNAITQTIAWCVIFYFASAGASAAYLTVSEIFPLEVRAKAIAVFFAIAQCFGALGPVIYGALIGDGSQTVPAVPGLPARRGRDDRRRTGRLVPRGRCRRQVAGRHRHPTGSRRRPPPDGFSPCGGGNPALLALSPGGSWVESGCLISRRPRSERSQYHGERDQPAGRRLSRGLGSHRKGGMRAPASFCDFTTK